MMSIELHDDIKAPTESSGTAMNYLDVQLAQVLHDERVRRLNPRASSDIRWRRRPGSSGRDANGVPREHGGR